MGWDDLVGADDIIRSGVRAGMADGATARSRANILAETERDLQRKRARDQAPTPPMRWRFHAGTWQRWSELDAGFATMEPPGTLLEHVAASGMPDDDEELVFVDGAWRVADDHLAAD